MMITSQNSSLSGTITYSHNETGIADATEAGTSDVTYDLNGNGEPTDEDDLTLQENISVGVEELE